MNNWIEISTAALTSNLEAIRQAAAPAEVLAVIKARAYGHGAELCGRVLTAAGARWLGVTCAGEGARVRAALAGVAAQPDVLLMSGFLPEDVDAIRSHALTPVVWTAEQVHWLAAASPIAVHVEVDTGMGRQGVPAGAALAALLAQMHRAGLVLDGLFTHLSSSEVADSAQTLRQRERFVQAVRQVARAGLQPRWLHVGNTSAVDNPAPPTGWLGALADGIGARTLVRTGLGLYGLCLPLEGDVSPQLRAQLTPVLTWKARVLAVRELAPGDTVGYGAAFVASRPMRVALLPVGYADGLRRELSSSTARPGGWVMLAGQRAPILGRVSMNLTVVDVSALAQVAAGEVATVLGPGVTAEDHAALAGTISYEILCGLHPCI